MLVPMGGFETYLVAAVREEKVPIALTLDRSAAQYFVVSTETDWREFVHSSAGSSASGRVDGGTSRIMLIEAKTESVAWTCELQKGSNVSIPLGVLPSRDQRSIAGACAKQLREFIENPDANHGRNDSSEIIATPTPGRTQSRNSGAGGAVSTSSPSNPQSSQKIEMECRDPATTGRALKSDEMLVNGMVCKVINSSQPLPSPVSSTTHPAPQQMPNEPGMYVEAGKDFTKILGQIVTFTRTGSLLVSGATAGIKTRKENVQLLGAHAQTVTDNNPVFYFLPAKQEADVGVNAGDLILIRLEEKEQRRQFEVGAQGLWRASSGISLTHQIQLTRSEEKAGTYKLTPAVSLEKGEYALYLTRGEGMPPYIYDFSVREVIPH
jgi:hypothetical protein